MNISRLDVVRAIPADDLPDFAEAIADAAHYLADALDSIPESEDAKAKELWQALEALNTYARLSNRELQASETYLKITERLAAEITRGWHQ